MESRLRAPSLCAASCDSGYALSKSTRAAPPAPMIFCASPTTLAAAAQCNQRHCNCCTFGNQKAAMDAVIIAAAAGHAMGCAHSIRRIRRIRQHRRHRRRLPADRLHLSRHHFYHLGQQQQQQLQRKQRKQQQHCSSSSSSSSSKSSDANIITTTANTANTAATATAITAAIAATAADIAAAETPTAVAAA